MPGSDWLEEDDDDAVNNINSTITLKSVKSSRYFSKLGKMVKKLFKMVVNVEKLLKLEENGDFQNFSKKRWNVEKCWWKHKNFYTDLLLNSGY